MGIDPPIERHGARGRRVVVRHVVAGRGPSGGPAMTDVVGRLTELTEETACIERRDGSLVRVPLADVVTWKVVPDRPVRSRRALTFDADELTRIMSRGWPAVVSEPLGEWELRSSGGFTGRANSVAVHGDPGLPFDDALTAVEEFYATHRSTPTAQVAIGSAHEQAFLEAGWTPGAMARPGALVQVADLARDQQADPEARIAPRADDAWLSLYPRAEDPALARAVLEGPPTVGFVAIGDPVVAIGRVVVTGEWVGVAAVEVVPDRRREGLGLRIVRTALAWAVESGADKAHLQTMRDNTASLALYAPFGFVDHHEYRYLQPGRPTLST
ncbi:MAG: GNAT family N-acetyltransferase [Aeromicrobium sp.]